MQRLGDIIFAELQMGGARPEREKAGLLLGRPGEEGLPSSAGARRPADIWVRRGIHSEAEALDFAVTSGLRAALYRRIVEDQGILFAGYEAFKRDYKQTDRVCQDQGLRFTPVILEAHGGG